MPFVGKGEWMGRNVKSDERKEIGRRKKEWMKEGDWMTGKDWANRSSRIRASQACYSIIIVLLPTFPHSEIHSSQPGNLSGIVLLKIPTRRYVAASVFLNIIAITPCPLKSSGTKFCDFPRRKKKYSTLLLSFERNSYWSFNVSKKRP